MRLYSLKIGASRKDVSGSTADRRSTGGYAHSRRDTGNAASSHGLLPNLTRITASGYLYSRAAEKGNSRKPRGIKRAGVPSGAPALRYF